MKNFIQEGNIVNVTAPYDVASGAGALVGSLFGVATVTAASGADVPLRVTGVVELNKVTGGSTAIAQGAKVYWDNTNKRCTGSASGNSLIGVALAAAGDSAATVTVLLNGISI